MKQDQCSPINPPFQEEKTEFVSFRKSQVHFNNQNSFSNSAEWLEELDKALEPMIDLDNNDLVIYKVKEEFDFTSSFHSSKLSSTIISKVTLI